MNDDGNSVANWLAALSNVLRSMVKVSPWSVRLAEGPLTLSVALVTATVMPSSLSNVLIDETGNESGAALPSASMPLASTVTGTPAMDMFWISVEPVSLPVVPSEAAVAVDVTLPMLMKPSSRETPVSVALASAVAVVLGTSEVEVADMPPMPMSDEEPASGLPEPDGAVTLVSVDDEPDVGLSSPRVALAVLPLAVL